MKWCQISLPMSTWSTVPMTIPCTAPNWTLFAGFMPKVSIIYYVSTFWGFLDPHPLNVLQGLYYAFCSIKVPGLIFSYNQVHLRKEKYCTVIFTYLLTGKWIPDRNKYYLIKPKHDNWLSVDLGEFPCFYLNLPVVNLKLFFLLSQQYFVHNK